MPGWSNLTLVTDAELGQIEPQAVVSGAPWGATTWATARAEAKRQLKVLIELAYPTIVGVADRILDRFRPDYALSYISSAYADITTETTSDDENDVNLTAIFVSTDNRLYIAADYQFEGLWVKLRESLNAQASVLTAKYWGGTGWLTLSATDGTVVSGKTFAQSGRITWTIPSDWQRVTLGPVTDEYFWVELSVGTAFSSGSTKASQILPIRAPDGLKRVAALMALHVILNGLERQAGRPEEWAAKAKFYRDEAMALFDLLKVNGGIPLDRNRDEVVTPAEIQDTKPLRLGRA